jgi:hypothetical protein
MSLARSCSTSAKIGQICRLYTNCLRIFGENGFQDGITDQQTKFRPEWQKTWHTIAVPPAQFIIRGMATSGYPDQARRANELVTGIVETAAKEGGAFMYHLPSICLGKKPENGQVFDFALLKGMESGLLAFAFPGQQIQSTAGQNKSTLVFAERVLDRDKTDLTISLPDLEFDASDTSLCKHVVQANR